MTATIDDAVYPGRCIADRLGFYVCEAIKLLRPGPESAAALQFRERAMAIVKGLRGDFYLNGKNPRVIAACILYIASKDAGLSYTQVDMLRVMELNDPARIRVYHKGLREHLQKQGI